MRRPCMRGSLMEYTFGWYLVYQYKLSKNFPSDQAGKDYCDRRELVALVMQLESRKTQSAPSGLIPYKFLAENPGSGSRTTHTTHIILKQPMRYLIFQQRNPEEPNWNAKPRWQLPQVIECPSPATYSVQSSYTFNNRLRSTQYST